MDVAIVANEVVAVERPGIYAEHVVEVAARKVDIEVGLVEVEDAVVVEVVDL
ncbi:hypothetical protein D3C83_280190 [compost metagenome]